MGMFGFKDRAVDERGRTFRELAEEAVDDLVLGAGPFRVTGRSGHADELPHNVFLVVTDEEVIAFGHDVGPEGDFLEDEVQCWDRAELRIATVREGPLVELTLATELGEAVAVMPDARRDEAWVEELLSELGADDEEEDPIFRTVAPPYPRRAGGHASRPDRAMRSRRDREPANGSGLSRELVSLLKALIGAEQDRQAKLQDKLAEFDARIEEAEATQAKLTARAAEREDRLRSLERMVRQATQQQQPVSEPVEDTAAEQPTAEAPKRASLSTWVAEPDER
jgi:hypothetical protein